MPSQSVNEQRSPELTNIRTWAGGHRFRLSYLENSFTHQQIFTEHPLYAMPWDTAVRGKHPVGEMENEHVKKLIRQFPKG